ECCGLKLNKQELLMHLRNDHHSKVSVFKCKIYVCNRIYSSIRSYEKHLNRSHSEIIYSTAHSTGNGEEENLAPDYNCEVGASLNDESACIPTQLASLSDEGTFVKNFVTFCLKLKEAYVLSHATYLKIMNDMVALFSSFHKDVLNFQHINNTSSSALDQTEYLFDKTFLSGVWEKLQSKTIFLGYCESIGLVKSRTISLGDKSFQYVPVLSTLKNFLQHPDVWHEINKMEEASSSKEVLSNYTDGDHFKQHTYFKGEKRFLRLHFYCDELELCNPLGSSKKKNKLMCIYYYIGNIGTKHCSSLSNIFAAILVTSSLLEVYGFSSILEPLIKDLKQLEREGLALRVSENSHRVFGTLATVSADNLGAHDIAGFRKCFSSGRICRFCMCMHNELKTKKDEDSFVLRTSATHNMYVSYVQKDPSLTSAYGVARSCPLAELSGFCPTSAFPPDIMHDCMEGVIPKFLSGLFRHFKTSGLCSFVFLNAKIQQFKFGKCDIKNKPRCLPAGNVIHSDGSLKLSASESWCLFRLLPIIIGDAIPDCDPGWQLLLLLSEILEIVFAPNVILEETEYLKAIIQEFYWGVVKFSPSLIVPKFHFMLHYPRLLKYYGPLRHLWCMRFESFHRKVKRIVKNTQNFKNVCCTVAERLQLKKCYEHGDKYCLNNDLTCERQKHINLSQLPLNVQTFLLNDIGLTSASDLYVATSVTLNGIVYCAGYVFVVDIIDDVPVFVKVVMILITENATILYGNYLKPISFNHHLRCFSVQETEETIFLKPGSQAILHPLDMYKISGNLYIRLSYRLCSG
uniref:C2H2-type domain-containing protein n=1 Tax=Ciona intestinalis TaxID=7719 RepID=H2Y2P4_CIOIN